MPEHGHFMQSTQRYLVWFHAVVLEVVKQRLGLSDSEAYSIHHAHAVHPPSFPGVGLLFPAPAPPDKLLGAFVKCKLSFFSSVPLFTNCY
jgi:hypothetical protein